MLLDYKAVSILNVQTVSKSKIIKITFQMKEGRTIDLTSDVFIKRVDPAKI